MVIQDPCMASMGDGVVVVEAARPKRSLPGRDASVYWCTLTVDDITIYLVILLLK